MSKKSKEKNASFTSGAVRSGKLPNTTRVPIGFIEMIATRGDEGEEKYGRHNYRRGLTDTEFIEQGFAHGVKHLQALANYYHDHGTFPRQADDDLAGAAWSLMMLWEARERQLDTVPV